MCTSLSPAALAKSTSHPASTSTLGTCCLRLFLRSQRPDLCQLAAEATSLKLYWALAAKQSRPSGPSRKRTKLNTRILQALSDSGSDLHGSWSVAVNTNRLRLHSNFATV